MKQETFERWALMGTCMFLCVALMLRAEPAKGDDPPLIAGAMPKADDASDEKAKVIEADLIRAKKIIIETEDKKSRIIMTTAGSLAGIWVENEGSSVCLVAQGNKGGLPYFGTNPKKNEAGGCPLAIAADGSIQLAQKGKVKFITVEQLIRFAK